MTHADSSDQRTDAYLRQVRATIDTYGVAVQGVGAGAGGPQFAYTVGLASQGQPEFLAFGLPMPVAQQLLNDLAGLVLDQRWVFSCGDTVHGLVRGYPVRLVQVTDSRVHLTVANQLYGDPARGPVPALQIVFPDAEGRWPWQPGSEVAALPVLGPVPGSDEGREQRLPTPDEH